MESHSLRLTLIQWQRSGFGLSRLRVVPAKWAQSPHRQDSRMSTTPSYGALPLIMDESEDESSVCRALIKVLQLGVVGWASYSRPITSDTNPLTGACDPLLAHSLGQRLIPLLDPMPRIYVGICGALGLSGGWLPCSSMLTRC